MHRKQRKCQKVYHLICRLLAKGMSLVAILGLLGTVGSLELDRIGAKESLQRILMFALLLVLSLCTLAAHTETKKGR